MKKIVNFVIVGALAAESLVLGQGSDAAKILEAARAAMGADKVATTSLAATGKMVRLSTGAMTDPSDYEMAIELPDKFYKKEVVAVLGDNVITRTSGFNGDGLIDATDVPQGMFGGGGGGRVMVRSGDGTMSGGGPGGAAPDPAAVAASRKGAVLTAKQDFARLTLGLLASSFSGYPLQFATDAPAVTADGKNDVITVTGEGGFAAKLYVDRATHLPAMITWMGKEPVVRTMSSQAGAPPPNGTMITGSGSFAVGGGSGATVTTGSAAQQMMQSMQSPSGEPRPLVEYRMTYGDYKVTGGINMPTRLHRTIDGKPSDDLVLSKITLNPKIDPSKFATVK